MKWPCEVDSTVSGKEWEPLFSLWQYIICFVMNMSPPPLLFEASPIGGVYGAVNSNVCLLIYDVVACTVLPAHLKNVLCVQLVPLPPIEIFFLYAFVKMTQLIYVCTAVQRRMGDINED